MIFEGSFKNKDAQNLVYKAFVPDEPGAAVVFVHGMGEHSLKYDGLASKFYSNNFAFFAYDQRGHGRSDGKRCCINKHEDLLDDLRQFVEIAKAVSLQEDVYLLGNSAGGLTALVFAQRYGRMIKGVAASSPALRLKNPPGRLEASLIGPLSFLFPDLTISNRIPFEYITHDSDVIEEQKADKLALGVISLGMFAELTKAMKYAFDNASGITIPALFLHGTGDKVTDSNATKEFYQKVNSSDKQLKLYDGLYHELMKETDREKVMDDILNWISETNK